MKFTRDKAKHLAQLTVSDVDGLIVELDKLRYTVGGDWAKYGAILSTWIKNGMIDEAPFTIFAKGNNKLPFYSFSALSIATCPAKGPCAKYCYSLKGWRYPCVLFRQIQNTLLIKTQSLLLIDAWLALPKSIFVRLYVDGDIDSIDTLKFWFGLLEQRKDIQAYGYSKSFHLFRLYADLGLPFPSNYKLNLSSGSIYTKKLLHDIPIVRGDFIAVPIAKEFSTIPNSTKYSDKGYINAVRESGKKLGIERAFICTGKCGSCTKKGHACGLDSFKDVPILIGIH